MNRSERLELLELTSRLHDDCLEPEGFERLEELLREQEELRALYLRATDLHSALGQRQVTSAERATGDLQKGELEKAVSEIIGEPARVRLAAHARQRRIMLLGNCALALATSLLFAVTLFLWSAEGPAAGQFDVLCSVTNASGDVFVGSRLADDSMSLVDGQSIRTEGAQSSVSLRFADGTHLRLAGDTSARCEGSGALSKNVFLEYGVLTANVTPQKRGNPLNLYTNTAALEVVGTDFLVEATQDVTKLAVTEGDVLMSLRGRDDQVRLSSGEHSEASFASLRNPERSREAPRAWRQSFDDGLPDEWVQGEWAPGGEGKGFVGAVRATKQLSPRRVGTVRSSEGKYYEVLSEQRFAKGLVRIEEGTSLSYRVKMDNPGWYLVFICVPSPDPEVASWNYIMHPARSDAVQEPGVWSEVTLPLEEFRMVGDRGNPPRGKIHPPIGSSVAWVLFTTHERDRGLMIDDLAIEPAVRAAAGNSSKKPPFLCKGSAPQPTDHPKLSLVDPSDIHRSIAANLLPDVFLSPTHPSDARLLDD